MKNSYSISPILNFSISCYFILFAFNISFAQSSPQVQLSGIIKSKATGEIIPRASIAILNSGRGTIANKEGRFTLSLDNGRAYKIRLRAIGYKPDTISITLNSSSKRTFELAIEAIIGKEIIVSGDASRIEARRIMHEVIRRKKEWQAKLNDYQCSAYSRWNLRSLSGSDTTVQSVLESTADCFWKKDKGFSEIITSRRQTANFPPELNAFSVGDIVNFYDNRVEFNDFSLIGPVADDAFGSYDYDLKGTGIINGDSVYQISVEPDLLTEGFDGILWIDQTDYTIAYLDLSPSKAVKIAPLKELHLQQTFELFENNFYLPVDLRTNVSVKLQLPFIPEYKFELLSVLQNYSVNKGIDDSLFKNRHRVAPLADSVDTAKWATARAVPLAKDEESAYHRIDSTVAEARKDSSVSVNLLDVLEYIEVPRYNHVEGWRFGLSKQITPVHSFPFSIDGSVAYGLDDKLWKYGIGFKQGILWTTSTNTQISGDLTGGLTSKTVKEPVVLLALSAKYFDDLTARGKAYSSIFNTIISLVYNKDYQEFYHEKGYTATLEFNAVKGPLFLSYKNTRIWDAGILHIVNPDSLNSKLHLSVFTILAGPVEINYPSLGGLSITAKADFEISSKHIGSDYNYSILSIEANLKKRFGAIGLSDLTFRSSFLNSGELPRWHSFFFETRSGFFSHQGYFRGLAPFEMLGGDLTSLNFEHNFYDLPTRILGIHFLDPFDLHWLLHLGAGTIEPGGTLPLGTPPTFPYYEIGFGIGNIYNILQLEGTWRLSHRMENNFYPTLDIHFSF